MSLTGISHIRFTESLLQTLILNNTVISSPSQDNCSRLSIPCRKNRQKVAHIRQESTFSHRFGRPLPLPVHVCLVFGNAKCHGLIQPTEAAALGRAASASLTRFGVMGERSPLSGLKKRCDPQVTSCLHNVSAHINIARSESEKMLDPSSIGHFA